MNELNGPDRLVNGVGIQSKYCESARATISAAFDSTTGEYRYLNQMLEVPADQYDACVELMKERIRDGKVKGFENPNDAGRIVRKGVITYKQARNIARAGNIDSIVYDAKSNAVTSSYVFALSFGVVFAFHRWRGEDSKLATKIAVESALKVGGISLISGILTSQLLRSELAATGAITLRSGLKSISAGRIGKQAIHRLASASVGKTVTGVAAINHMSKLLRTNVITASVTTLVTTSPDLYRTLFEKSVSWQQLTKNLAVNGAGVVGGAAGWLGGAATGASIGSLVPGIGTGVGGVIGGLVGALGGGVALSATTKLAADRIVEDDSKRIMDLLRSELQIVAFEYLLTELEFESVMQVVSNSVTVAWIRSSFALVQSESSEENFRLMVRAQFEPICGEKIAERTRIELPTEKELLTELQNLSLELTQADS